MASGVRGVSGRLSGAGTAHWAEGKLTALAGEWTLDGKRLDLDLPPPGARPSPGHDTYWYMWSLTNAETVVLPADAVEKPPAEPESRPRSQPGEGS